MQQLLYIIVTGCLLIFLWTTDMMKQVGNPDFVAEIYAGQMFPMFSQQMLSDLSKSDELDEKTRSVLKSLSEFKDAKLINLHNKSDAPIEKIQLNLPGVKLYILHFHDEYIYIYPDQLRVPLPDLPAHEDMQLTAIYDVQSKEARNSASEGEQTPIILDSASGSGKIIYYYFMGSTWISLSSLLKASISILMLLSCGMLILMTYLNWKKGVSV